ncbi:class I SAM-dependent methyltransferase [Gramella sp. GC03-9]|uniref:Class I SAM-dependent methyltransferase n=1 Tax=Christiangramia oceanisediminis TaxID=2920386 RepID=A0A9X2I2W0_9FLAO|nr:class I SAM-dependent methyltransferase [Gramella oceanisediminis]MCP9200006.1 class I SAM-dependent methyltransferase [Gramella oceanisediminis]
MKDLKSHWNDIYGKKEFEETSWYQSRPESSLNLIESLALSKNANIIDIGGGDSFLVDNLLKLNYKSLNVLDISGIAIEKAQHRLGSKADEVKWIESDVTTFETEEKFDLWHDRAAFHFLTEDEQVEKYLEKLNSYLKPGGYLILATFSDKGPTKCSGIEIRQYSTEDLKEMLESDFEVISLQNMDHSTPWDATQNFSFGLFRKK